MKEYKKRLTSILGNNNEVSDENTNRYRSHLLKHLQLPITVTGIEDFPWEEPYVIGGWNKAEYEKLEKTNPSYTDTFELHGIEEADDEELIARLKRTTDGKRFEVELSWLCATERKTEAYTLLDDYSVWVVNY
ncbi:MAG: hypothetical protein ACSHYA_14410 [Opitutaceae bacterium]